MSGLFPACALGCFCNLLEREKRRAGKAGARQGSRAPNIYPAVPSIHVMGEFPANFAGNHIFPPRLAYVPHQVTLATVLLAFLRPRNVQLKDASALHYCRPYVFGLLSDGPAAAASPWGQS